MSQFDAAKAKYEKNRLAQARPLPKVDMTPDAPKKEEPKPQVKSVEPMTLKISGPVEMTLTVDYAGTLTAGQQTEESLRAMFKKLLVPIGRVR